MTENNQAQKTFQRKTIIIKKNLQYRYMFLISISVFIAFIIMSLDMIWTVSKVVNEHPMMQPMLDEIFSMAPLFFVKVIMYMLIVLIVSAVISHKMAGPVYKFEKSCKIISDGDLSHRVYLRKGDHMVELQESFNSMVDNFHKYAVETAKLRDRASTVEALKEQCREYDEKVREIFPDLKV